MIRPNERKKLTPLEISNWALQYVEEHEPLNLYDFAIEAYELGFQDAERIAEQKENEEMRAQFLGSVTLPQPRTPFLVSAKADCPLTIEFPKHAPGVLVGCTCIPPM